jgi:hypothetical protein
MRFRLCSALLLLSTFTGTIAAQAPLSQEPPVPADPLEIVTGAVQPVQDAQQRIEAVSLLNKARDLSNVRAQPYHLKTSFVSTGGLSTDGNWMLEDMAAARAYRWTAQGPGYSAVNLYPSSTANGLYGSMTGGDIPLRLAQVRGAMFFTYPNVGPQASVRTATASLNGVEQRCVLVAMGLWNRSFSGGRSWEESEYCVDSKTGLLTTYSVAPGMFVQYDYSSGIDFHGKKVPTSFRITEAGRTVIEARTLSATDPSDVKPELFNPTGLPALGTGRVMNPPAKVRIRVPVPGQNAFSADPAMQIVVLHGSAGPNGRLTDIEILASSDSRFNQTALQSASDMKPGGTTQPGATQQSQEMFLTMEFVGAR